jgi:hypothetical protein
VENRTANGILDGRRFGRLLLRELAGSYRGLLIAMAAVGGALVIISALAAMGHAAGAASGGGISGLHLWFFRNMLFLGGFILTSMAFRELRQGGGGIFYFTLPGSLLEKLLAKLLLTSLGYALGCAIFLSAAAAVSQLINVVLFGFGNGLFNPLDPVVLRMGAVYLVTQSVFLLGSIWFRKLAFLKTVLWILIISVGALVVFAVAARIFLAHPLWAGGSLQLNFGSGGFSGMFGRGPGGPANIVGVRTAGQVAMFGLLAPVCWLAAYFRLGETEV